MNEEKELNKGRIKQKNVKVFAKSENIRPHALIYL